MTLAIGLFASWTSAWAFSTARLDVRTGARVFTSEDGLPPSGVSAIFQTRDGYLWIGTFGGLARFDGLTFTVFKGQSALNVSDPEGGQYAGPASDRILALYEDDGGRLWIGTQDAGMSVFERGSFRHLSICDGTCQVDDILQGSDKALWIATSAGLFTLDPISERIARMSEGSGDAHLTSDRQGRIYLGGYNGLKVAVGRKLQSIPLPGGDKRVLLLKRSGDDLLISTEHALYLYDPVRRQWRPTGISEFARYAARDADGQWWVALASGRLVRQDRDGTWRDVPELSIGITSLAWDDEGNLWVGSGSKGLLRVRKPLFGLLSVPHLQANVSGRAVIADGRGGLWFGSNCGPLLHWRHDDVMRSLPIGHALGNHCVSSLLLDRHGVLWVGTTGGELGRVANGEPEHIATWPTGMSLNIWPGDAGRYLVSSGHSTFELEIDAEGRIAARRRIEALEGMNINNVVAAAKGGRWFVGDQGVLRLVADKVVERWTPREGLSSRFARALYEDEKTGVLWVGTYGGGLNRIRNGKVRRYDTHNGLTDDTVSCILADDRGRLWLAGNRGVTLLPAPREAATGIESMVYSASDGLVPAEINGGVPYACHRDTQGRFWFSLVEGFAAIDPASVPKVRAVSLRPHIEHVSVAGRPRDIVGSTLTLESFARNLEIRYAAINLSRPQETRFRFRLSGIDHDWVEAGRNRSILYPSIPWGEHLFEVQARTLGGPWSRVSASLRILHPQPWYQRPWLWMLATSLGLLVLVGGTRFEKSRSESEGRESVRSGRRRGR